MTSNARTNLPWLLLLANAALFSLDRIGILQLTVPIGLVASAIVLIAIYRRDTVQRPVAVIVATMGALAIVDLADAGLVPVIRI